MADPADTQRLVGDLARLGVVRSVDHAGAMARVAIGDLLIDMPWLAHRAGGTRSWSPPSVGEQVLVVCPEGDSSAALIVGSLSSDANQPAGTDAATVTRYADEARIGYDPVTHTLTAILPAGAIARIVATGGLRIEGDVEITGALSLSGQLYAQDAIHSDEDVSAGKVSLQHHVHTATQPGSGVSGVPKA